MFNSSRKLLWKLLCVCSVALVFASYPCSLTVQHGEAETLLDIRSSMSFKISKSRLSFKIGEVANVGTSTVPSGKLELALWLSRQPYDATQPLRGSKLARCTFEGIIGGETIANASCQARIRPLKRGKYYIIIALSELDQTTNRSVIRDTFTFSKRLKF